MKVTQQVLAAHLFCAPGTIKSYETAGLIKRGKTGYDLDECRKLVLTHLRDKAGGRMGNVEGLNLTVEKAKRERSQTDKNEFALGILKGTYVLAAEVQIEIEQAFGIVRERLLAIPGASADRCAESDPKRRDMITAVLNEDITEALNDLSSPDDYVRKAGAASILDLQATTEAELDRVGGPAPVRSGKNKRKPGAVAAPMPPKPKIPQSPPASMRFRVN
jgi:hypothetical protein